jgi:predicted MFS family arabinose efflux permease
VALGLARFAYALLLGPMRADLGWTYFTAGVMNTGNAAGYLLGALAMPRALARFGPRACALAGGLATAVLLALHGLVHHDGLLLALRLASGAASAATFVGGGLLAARLGSQALAAPAGGRALPGAGLVLGLYYGGTGLGIVVAALLVPAVLQGMAGSAHGWQGAWLALGGVALAMTGLMAAGTPADAPPAAATPQAAAVPWRRLLAALAGYACFGLGYIGYMTFIISLLREQRLGEGAITGFYVLLGLGVVASSWLWAGLLQRWRGGGPLALLNGLLALATVLPVAGSHALAVFGSGVLFGAVFLSVVASTTALVRHNLPPAAWPRGITGFTIVFAVGQIVGPSVVGLIADGPGGLARGFVISAGLLALGSALAALQRPLAQNGTPR